MTIASTYIKNAIRTESKPTPEVNERFQNALSAIVYILDEQKAPILILDEIKKHIFYGKKMSKDINDIIGTGNPITDPNDETVDSQVRLVHAMLGKLTEAYEFAESVIALLKGDTSKRNVDNLVIEIGDGQWYDAIALDELGVPLSLCLGLNIKKLRERFPEKFDEDQAINRDHNKEADLVRDEIKEELE